MLDKFVGLLECELCKGALKIDIDGTVDDYIIYASINSHNIFDKITDIIGKYIVYKCQVCGQIHKYTHKDLEYIVRKKLTERCFLLLSRGAVSKINFSSSSFLIYCGKCGGMDGKGSCFKEVYNSCEIKRFPINVL